MSFCALSAFAFLLAQEQAPPPPVDPADDEFTSIVERRSYHDLMAWTERHPWGTGTEVRRFLVRFEEVRGGGDPVAAGEWRARAAFLAEILADEALTPWILSVMRWNAEQRARHDTVRSALNGLPAAIETGDIPSPRAELDSLRPPTAPEGTWDLCAPELTRIAGALWAAGARDDALSLLEGISTSAARTRDGDVAARCANFLGQASWKEGRLRPAAEHFAFAVEIARGSGDDAEVLERLCDLSAVRTGLGDLEGALADACEAEERARSHFAASPLRRALLVEATSFLGLGDPEAALDALAGAESAGGAQPPQDETQARVLLLHGDVLCEMRRLEPARAYYERALELSSCAELRAAAPLLRGIVLLSFGRVLGDLGQHELALGALDQALELFRREGDSCGVAQVEENRGLALARAGRRDEADAAFARGLSCVEKEARPSLTGACAVGRAENALRFDPLPAELPAWLASAEGCSRELHDLDLASRVESLRGELLARAGDPGRALEHLERSVDALEKLRGRLGAPGWIARCLRDRSDPYREAAFAAARAGAADEAWRYGERIHANALIELRARPRGPLADVPLDPKVQSARRALAQRESLLRRAASEDRAALLEPVRAAEDDLDRAWIEAEVRAPRSARLSGTGPGSFDAARTQALLSTSGLDAIVEYVIAERETLALAITSRERTARILPIGAARIESLLARLRAPIESLGRGEIDLLSLGFDAAAARELWSQLMEPLGLAPGRRIAIVPDGALWNLPFEMLVTGGEARAADPAHAFAHLAGLRFLVEDQAVVYMPCAAWLGAAAPASGAKGTVLFQASAQPDRRSAADGAASLFGRELFAPVRELAYASANDVRKEAASAAFLHFAGQAVLDSAHPAASHLVLAGGQGPGVRVEPGRLEAWEIDRLTLRARLVVLAACGGSEGRCGPGQGLLGLTRSFLAAGADEVIAGLWPVEDSATTVCMKSLYTHLARGESVIDALRSARLETMRSEDARGFVRAHPWFWAAWIDHRGI